MLTDEEKLALRELPDWLYYLGASDCPKCRDANRNSRGFKMCAPPICITCNWKLAIHPQALEAVLAELLVRAS